MAKQKLKTHKATAKRIKITGSGKVLRRKVAIEKYRRDKSPAVRHAKGHMVPLAKSDRKRLKRLLPYADL